MISNDARLEADKKLLREAQGKGRLAVFLAYFKLSGPGWLQSAITLGGGSLTGSLYLGVLAGFTLLWLQPVAMVFGIIMLSAIGYVTMTTGKRPFQAINEHVNPVLGWGWALASLLASMVWALPQYSLATGVLQQNLFPGLLGAEGTLGDTQAKLLIVSVILIASILITWSYGGGGWGVKLYEGMLKLMVATIVICFFGVVIRMAMNQGFDWGRLLGGFVPDPRAIFNPAQGFAPLLEAIAPEQREYWSRLIVDKQRDVMMTAAATAVGINMTFLFPYTLLTRRWSREFIGLSKFDLSTGMFIPFVLATSCVIVAAASQFHTVPQPGFLEGESGQATASARQRGEYTGFLNQRLVPLLQEELREVPVPPIQLLDSFSDWEREEMRRLLTRDTTKLDAVELATLIELGRTPEMAYGALTMEELNGQAQARLQERRDALDPAEKRMSATLVTRDAFDLAKSLAPLTGDLFGNIIFGIGVLGMTLSTITILMLISGFVVCEMLGLPPTGWPHRLGTLAAATGALGPFFWGQAAFWLAVPTSIFGLILLPIAYWTFFLLMNSDSLLGPDRPQGRSRTIWNSLMALAASIATGASLWMVWVKTGMYGIAAIAVFLLAALVAHLVRAKKERPQRVHQPAEKA